VIGPSSGSAAHMDDADARFAERLADDLERVLGEGILIPELTIGRDGRVVIHLACLTDGQVRAVDIESDDLLDAYRDAVRAAAEIRLGAAWWQIVGPT